MVKVSVIIPIYNMENYLKECLNSILNQTLKKIEVIAVNDGSTDNSLKILQKFKETHNNIVIINQKNQGQAIAKNEGLKLAKGKYVIFMDPDDYYPSDDCIEALYYCAEDNKVLLCGGIVLNYFNGEKKVDDKEFSEKFFNNSLINTRDYDDIYYWQRFLFNRQILLKNNIFFPDYRRYEDPPFIANVFNKTDVFYGLKKETYVYRIDYKKINFSLKVCQDVLKGIADTIEICKNNRSDKVFDRRIRDIDINNIIPFYKYSYKGYAEIDREIEKINHLIEQWKGQEFEFVTKDKAIEIRNTSLKHYEEIKKLLIDGKRIILYGAGVTTKKFLSTFDDVRDHIIGIAVTQKGAKSTLDGLDINEISKYDNVKSDTIILVTTIMKYQDEIHQYLSTRGYENVISVDMQKILLADELKSENIH